MDFIEAVDKIKRSGVAIAYFDDCGYELTLKRHELRIRYRMIGAVWSEWHSEIPRCCIPLDWHVVVDKPEPKSKFIRPDWWIGEDPQMIEIEVPDRCLYTGAKGFCKVLRREPESMEDLKVRVKSLEETRDFAYQIGINQMAAIKVIDDRVDAIGDEMRQWVDEQEVE